jgi:type I restriction enzyme, R subunit
VRQEARAYEFDLLATRLQTEMLRRSASADNLRETFRQDVAELPNNINQVREKLPALERARSSAFWNAATIEEVETLRNELRGVMRFVDKPKPLGFGPKIIDVEEERDQIRYVRHMPKLEGLQLAAYRKRVEDVLQEMIEENPALQKIKAGRALSAADLEELCQQVATLHPVVDLRDLGVHYPELADHLDIAIRSIIGLGAVAVSARFEYFVHEPPRLTAKQLRFLALLKNHLARYGFIEIERLYEAPFTSVDTNGIDGVFSDDAQINVLLDIIGTFNPPPPATGDLLIN